MNDQLSIELTGTVLAIEEPKEYGANGFRKSQIAIEVEDGKYPQQIPIDGAGKKADLFAEAGIKTGDLVTVRCNLQGRERSGRYFVSLSAWKCEVAGAGQRQEPEHTASDPAPDAVDDDSDIPF